MVVNGKNPVPGYEEIESVESSNESAEDSAEDNLDQLNAAMAMPQRSLSLTKKERLLLRKQALQMKKRPLLAVGILTFPLHTLCSEFYMLLNAFHTKTRNIKLLNCMFFPVQFNHS